MAMAGAALVATPKAQAQITYHNEDLLLSFRNTLDTGAADVTVDLGQISTFLNLTCMTVLNNGVNNGYTPLFTESELITAFGGSLDNVGFTAVAVDNVSDTVWLTKAQPTVWAEPQYPPSQLGNPITVASRVGDIGLGLEGFDGTVVFSLDASGDIVSLDSGQAYSYQSLAAPADEPALINFGGEITGAYGGGLLESITTGNNTVYSALWLVPVSGSGAPTYKGYFTFNGATGELDYTAGIPVPPLSVSQVGTSVVVSWPATGTFTLQQNSDLSAPSGWVNSTYAITPSGGTNSVTISQPAGNLFFRLANLCP